MTWRDELDAFEEVLDSEEIPDAAEALALSERLRALAGSLPHHELVQLSERFGRLIERMRSDRDQVATQLSTVGSTRRALRGYAHLRSRRLGQRLWTSV